MLFDRHIVIDWSAANAPKLGPDSIWIAEHTGARVKLDNHRTRASAMTALRSALTQGIAEKKSVLVGVDFSLGFPTGFSNFLDSSKSLEPWLCTWEFLRREITDDERNRNNRFAVASAINASAITQTKKPGPFWGVPPKQAQSSLGATKPDFPYAGLAEFRSTETALAQKPFSVWQLLGAGAVGSQSLTGIAQLATLRLDPVLAPHFCVWPFETGFTSSSGLIVVAEVWPTLVPDDLLARVDHPVKDARQVTALAQWLSVLDRSGELNSWFEVAGLTDEVRNAAVEEEGWILGAGAA